MTEPSQFSSLLPQDSEMDAALSEVEAALARFERILRQHQNSLQRIGGRNSRRSTINKIINSSLTRILGTVLGRGRTPTPTVFNPSSVNTQKNNRFSISRGQLLGDLAGSLQKIGGRNL